MIARLQRFLPSLGVCLWLAIFLVINLSDWRLVLINSDGDPCRHWRNGNWMIEHRAVIHADHYSHTRPGQPLVSKEWLAEIVTAIAGNALGWGGIVALAAALIATTFWLLHRQLFASGHDPVVSIALVLLAMLACLIHWLARSLLVTHLLTVVFAWVLRDFDRDRVCARRLFVLLVPLMALWANLHGAFPTGLVLIALYAAGSAWNWWQGPADLRSAHFRKIAVLAALGVACALATLLTPNGWHLHAHILGFLQPGSGHRYTSEFMPPNFHWAGTQGFLLQLLLLLAMLMLVRPRLRATDTLLIAVWAWLSLRSARNVPIFALVVTPILAEHLQTWLNRDRSVVPSPLSFHRQLAASLAAMQRGAGGGWLVVVAVAGLIVALTKPLVETGIMANRFPVVAVRWLREHPDAVRGPVFNEMRWGGYMILAMPERPVFVDSRDDFYGDFIGDYIRPIEMQPGWEKVLEKYAAGWTLLPKEHPLNSLLALHTGWRRIYADDVAVVFGRDAR